MSAWQILLLTWWLAVPVQAAGWVWQRRHRNAGIVDALWAATLGAAALVCALAGPGGMWPRVAVALLGGGWSLRLAWHLWRRVRGETEDGRYARLRQRWGDDAWQWPAFFQLQAASVPLFALPFLAAAANPVARVTPWLLGAVFVWGVGIAGEATADAQLARFRNDPANRGHTCRAGLWRYSRHPNYFFEWLHWFAYVLLAIGSPLWWLAWSGPLVMYVFLRWLSGIPWTEAQALRTRGAEYRDYQRSTSIFFPWFPRRPSRGAHDDAHDDQRDP